MKNKKAKEISIDSQQAEITKILILGSDEKSFNQIVSFLEKRDCNVKVVATIGGAIQSLVSEKPDYVLISFSHPSRKVKNLPKIIASTFHIPTIGILEDYENKAIRELSQAPVVDRITDIASGPNIFRKISQLKSQKEKENHNEGDRPTSRESIDFGDNSNGAIKVTGNQSDWLMNEDGPIKVKNLKSSINVEPNENKKINEAQNISNDNPKNGDSELDHSLNPNVSKDSLDKPHQHEARRPSGLIIEENSTSENRGIHVQKGILGTEFSIDISDTNQDDKGSGTTPDEGDLGSKTTSIYMQKGVPRKDYPMDLDEAAEDEISKIMEQMFDDQDSTPDSSSKKGYGDLYQLGNSNKAKGKDQHLGGEEKNPKEQDLNKSAKKKNSAGLLSKESDSLASQKILTESKKDHNNLKNSSPGVKADENNKGDLEESAGNVKLKSNGNGVWYASAESRSSKDKKKHSSVLSSLIDSPENVERDDNEQILKAGPEIESILIKAFNNSLARICREKSEPINRFDRLNNAHLFEIKFQKFSGYFAVLFSEEEGSEEDFYKALAINLKRELGEVSKNYSINKCGDVSVSGLILSDFSNVKSSNTFIATEGQREVAVLLFEYAIDSTVEDLLLEGSKLKIDHSFLIVDQKMNIALFLFFEKNQKFIKYVSEESFLTNNQLDRLKKNKKSVYIEKKDLTQVKSLLYSIHFKEQLQSAA